MESYYGDIDKDFILLKKIGSGGTSKVYLSYHKDDPKKLYAVKVIKNTNSSDNKFFINEVNMLKEINHRNVVKLIAGGDGILTKDSGKSSNIQYIVLELIKYGELFDYIFFPQKGFGEDIGKYIFNQLLDGLEECHKKNIAHRDMKTENIMLDEDWVMKIADFGFATKLAGKKGNGLLYTALGTASYASPELLQKKPYLGAQSDIFSLGVSLFVLVTGKMPFKHAVVDDPYYKEIAKQNYERYWEKLSTKVPPVSDEFKDLFVRLIALDATSRPSISDARNHKWIFGYKANLANINKEFTERTKIVQTKKEIERKKEEEEEKARELKSQSQNKYKVFKSGNGENIELDISPNDYPIREYDESDRNPYTIIINGYSDPGKLFDFIQMRLLLLKGLEVKKSSEEKYKLTIGIDPTTQDVDFELGGDFLIDKVEALLELKSKDDKFIVELSRLSGNKYDFHRLFIELEKQIA